jgi:hypothetical protein
MQEEEGMKLVMIKNKKGIVDRYMGDVVEYEPWPHKWQGMGEGERLKNGIFIKCFGHGEFEVLRLREDVDIIP